MPAILTDVYDGLNKEFNELGDKELSDRAAMMKRQWRYYDGNQDKPLKVQPHQRDDNVITNHVGKAADRATEFVGVPDRFEVQGIGGEAEPNAETGELEAVTDATQDAVDVLYSETQDMLPEIVLSGLITGHTFLKLMQDDEGLPTVELIDPMYVIVFTDQRQPRKVLWYRMQWASGETVSRQDIVPVDLLPPGLMAGRPPEAGWAIIEYSGKGGANMQQTAAEFWNYDFSPIVQWRNKRRPHTFYGVSEFVGLDVANDTINFIDSNMARIIKYHAHPRTIGKGVDANKIQSTSVDGFYTIPDNGEVYNLEMQSDLSSSMNYLAMKKADFYSKARIVDVATVKDRLGQISNFGVRMMFSEMLEMSDEKRKFIGKGIGEALRRMAIMVGVQITEAPKAVWSDPLPMNRLEQLSAAQIEAGLKIVSKQTLAQDLGRDYIAEQERMREETQTAGDALASVLDQAGQTGAFGT